MQDYFNIQMSFNVIHHIDRVEKKNRKIIRMDSEKSIWQNSVTIFDKDSTQMRNRRKPPQPDKGRLQKPTANILLMKDWMLST